MTRAGISAAPVILVVDHDPATCELLRDDARSELKEEHRERQEGGGWRMKTCGTKAGRD